MDILLTHGYFLADDPVELKIMRPYAPLGLLSISAYLKRQGLTVKVIDTTFSERQTVLNELAASRPAIMGIYVNMMTKRSVRIKTSFKRKLESQSHVIWKSRMSTDLRAVCNLLESILGIPKSV